MENQFNVEAIVNIAVGTAIINMNKEKDTHISTHCTNMGISF